MKTIWMTLALACSLSTTTFAQQTNPDSSVKSSEGKAATPEAAPTTPHPEIKK